MIYSLVSDLPWSLKCLFSRIRAFKFLRYFSWYPRACYAPASLTKCVILQVLWRKENVTLALLSVKADDGTHSLQRNIPPLTMAALLFKAWVNNSHFDIAVFKEFSKVSSGAPLFKSLSTNTQIPQIKINLHF